MSKKGIRVNLGSLEYLTPEGKRGVLPWGTYHLENALFYGSVRSSRAGGWGWKLPNYTLIGYGQYCPYVEFVFSGSCRVFNGKTWPGPEEEAWGWRIGDRKAIRLEGTIKPSPNYRLEMIAVKETAESVKEEWVWERKPYTQGHLEIRPIRPGSPRFERLAMNWPWHRRRIFNHQFFGETRIFWVEKGPDSLTWLVLVGERGVKISSPDHILDPIQLWGGWYLASHPIPRDGGGD